MMVMPNDVLISNIRDDFCKGIPNQSLELRVLVSEYICNFGFFKISNEL